MCRCRHAGRCSKLGFQRQTRDRYCDHSAPFHWLNFLRVEQNFVVKQPGHDGSGSRPFCGCYGTPLRSARHRDQRLARIETKSVTGRNFGSSVILTVLHHNICRHRVPVDPTQLKVRIPLMGDGQMRFEQLRRHRQAERARSRTCTRAGPADREIVPSAVAVGQTTVSNCAASASGMKRVREA